MQAEGYHPANKDVRVESGMGPVALDLKASFALLSVTTRPAGLGLLLNGKPVGKAGLDGRKLEPGAYELLIDDRCYLRGGQRVVLKEGDERRLDLVGAARKSGLKVDVVDSEGNDLEGAVWVDGAKLGAAPGPFEVPFCSKKVEVRSGGMGNWSEELSLVENQVAARRARLTAPVAPVGTTGGEDVEPDNPWATRSGGSLPGNPWRTPWATSGPAKATRTKVTISTRPAGAKVKVAGTSRGASPVKMGLPLGTHEIQVSKEGYLPGSRYVKVTDADPISVSIALEPIASAAAKRDGTLFISSSPSGALLYVDGSSKGRTPISVTVTEGAHSLKLVSDGREPVEKRIRVDFARSTTVRRFIEIP